MMFTPITAILAVIAIVSEPIAAGPAALRTVGALKWIGEVVPGNGNITLVGNDIHDIFAQITTIKPDYTPAGLTAYDKSQASDIGVIEHYCGIFATADKRNFMSLQYDLRNAGGTCVTRARSCFRVSCWNTSGIYVCNDNDHDVSVPCKTVADYASYVGANCCGSDYTMSKGVSGQAFSPDGWNVNLAYANCNHASDADVPSEFVEPYVNGDCTD